MLALGEGRAKTFPILADQADGGSTNEAAWTGRCGRPPRMARQGQAAMAGLL